SPEHVDWFQPMPAEGILTRMLNNLRQVYTSLSDVKKLSVVADMLRALNPTRMSDLHEQAFLSYRNGDFGQALEHIERYLESSHDSEDRLRMQYYQRLFQRLSVSHN
ncbi:MAG TPA: tetratricopeptide repeat protein, partial [Chloroflexia bacterium]|nr:tetratricopeptide repeat protein [Chloroflexia bacterium]